MTVQERIEDIRNHPENHKHDYSGLIACCMNDGVLDTLIMDAHEGIIKGPNHNCDVNNGPCACGAWH